MCGTSFPAPRGNSATADVVLSLCRAQGFVHIGKPHVAAVLPSGYLLVYVNTDPEAPAHGARWQLLPAETAQTVCLEYLAGVFGPNPELGTGVMGGLKKRVGLMCRKRHRRAPL